MWYMLGNKLCVEEMHWLRDIRRQLGIHEVEAVGEE